MRSVSFSGDKSFLASGCDDNKARIWNVKSGELASIFSHDDVVSTVAFSANETLLALGSAD